MQNRSISIVESRVPGRRTLVPCTYEQLNNLLQTEEIAAVLR
jgi:hypothetical protein